MRFRLLRRRLTISAPRMAVRSAMPWPVRWAFIAVVFGFCAAISLWAFEFGKVIAGLERDTREELIALRAEVHKLREERDRAQAVVNTSDSLLMAEKSTQEHLSARNRQLEAENRALREDLGFFEQLIPAASTEGIAIRGLQADILGDAQLGAQLKWQVLVMQPSKNAPEFSGKLEVTLTGLLQGKAWMMNLPEGPRPLQMRQYRRLEGVVDLPHGAVVETVSDKVVEGGVARAVQALKL